MGTSGENTKFSIRNRILKYLDESNKVKKIPLGDDAWVKSKTQPTMKQCNTGFQVRFTGKCQLSEEPITLPVHATFTFDDNGAANNFLAAVKFHMPESPYTQSDKQKTSGRRLEATNPKPIAGENHLDTLPGQDSTSASSRFGFPLPKQEVPGPDEKKRSQGLHFPVQRVSL